MMMTNARRRPNSAATTQKHRRGNLGVEPLACLRHRAPDQPDGEDHDTERERHRRQQEQ
jgi:hypothetical protein